MAGTRSSQSVAHDMRDKTEELREKGNSSLKDEKYEEAVLYYTHAIKIDKKNHSLYGNRSLAFLKMQQFYFALEDANEAIRLKPDWAKGYFRKGEVEFSTFNYNDALFSYTLALMLLPNEPILEQAIEKTKRAMKQDEASDSQISWIGAAIGIFIGASIVVADQILTYKPTIIDPISMVLLTFVIAVVGYGAARGFRYYIKCQRIALLEPPVNLFKEEQESKKTTPRTKNTRIQGRQRFKRGKA